MIEFKLFSPNRLIFEKPSEAPEGLPESDLSNFTFQCSGDLCGSLIGETGKVELSKSKTFPELKADLDNVIQTDRFGTFRQGPLEGEYLIISGRDGETIGRVNAVMVEGTPMVEATQYIPVYTSDLKAHTFEEKTVYYKTAAEFKANLEVFKEDLRTGLS
jgi:hypothetical protein